MLTVGPALLAPGVGWTDWHLDPLVLTGCIVAVVVHDRGRRRGRRRHRHRAFPIGVAVLALALLSPVDAASTVRLSAHMVQHVLLWSVAAPLIACSRPVPALLRGSPPAVRRAYRDWVTGLRALGVPAGRWWGPVALVVSTATVWGWHARVPYEAAVRHDAVHALEHLTFLAAALWFWSTVFQAGSGDRSRQGAAVLLLFGQGLQTTLLAALMTFSTRPWYGVYAGDDATADQEVAGVIMWFPSTLVGAAVALWLLVDLLHALEPDVRAAPP